MGGLEVVVVQTRNIRSEQPGMNPFFMRSRAGTLLGGHSIVKTQLSDFLVVGDKKGEGKKTNTI